MSKTLEFQSPLVLALHLDDCINEHVKRGGTIDDFKDGLHRRRRNLQFCRNLHWKFQSIFFEYAIMA
jgi:hypothetical protein